MRLAFGDCVFDSATRQLTRRGEAVALSPKAYSLLETLLRERPRALSKLELHRAVWPDTFVADNSLARLVSELRAALDDRGHRGELLRTVHGFGYAWCGEAIEADAVDGPAPERSRCWLTWGRRLVPLSAGENIVGRSPEATLFIDSPRISRRHCRILVGTAGATIEDLGSKNGTYLEGARLEAPAAIADGDQVTVGQTVLTFRRDPEGVSTETELGPSLLDP